MTGNLGYGATIVSESEQAARSVRKITINNRSKVPDRQNTPGQSLARRLTTRDEGLGARRVQIGMGFPSSETADDNGTNAIPTAGRYAHPHDLTDVSNSYNAPGLLPATTYSYSSPSKPATNIHRERSAANVPLPTTPVNSQGNQYFSTPSSRDKARSRGDASTPYRNQHLSTPTSKERTRSRSETGDTPRAGSSSTGLYRSGKENATSNMSTSTTGTIMLGRDIPGMQAALDRRHARVDHRRTAED